MKTEFDKIMEELKQQMSSILAPDSSKEMIDKISSCCKQADKMAELYNTETKNYNELKNDYIKTFKNYCLPSKSNPMEEETSIKKEYSFEDALNEVMGNK